MKISNLVLWSLVIAGMFLWRPTAAASEALPYRDTRYQGQYVGQSVADPIRMVAGETKKIEITFKNTGVKSWAATGKEYVSMYTVGPRYRASEFKTKEWLEANQPARVKQTVSPRGKTVFTLILNAPQKPGNYREEFALVAENKTWIKGTRFYLLINVVDATVSQVVVPKDFAAVTSSANGVPVFLSTASSSFVSTSSFLREATSTSGLSSGEEVVFRDSAIVSTRALIAEPVVRVGLYSTTDDVRVLSEFPYQVFQGDVVKGVLSAGSEGRLRYATGTYHFQSEALDVSGPEPVRLLPFDPAHYFTLVNYQRFFSGRAKNFNIYRGTLEFRFSAKEGASYVINELPLDEYVAGVAETSDDAPFEYNKALQIAVRSYAYYHVRRGEGVSRAVRLFDVFPTTASQLYLGYVAEAYLPHVVAASEATRGMMVTYESAPVVTPYFTRSDGRTRSWQEVWQGTLFPWLQSVEAVYDKGKTKLGHGVGMSGSDAKARAEKDGWTFEQILTYYYQGTAVEKIY